MDDATSMDPPSAGISLRNGNHAQATVGVWNVPREFAPLAGDRCRGKSLNVSVPHKGDCNQSKGASKVPFDSV